MQKLEDFLYIIKNGENSKVEFKKEEAHNDSIAKEIVALLNFKGGTIIFGVDDNRNIVGISDSKFEERIMNIVCDKVFPPVIPEYEELYIDGKKLALLTFDIGVNKPYYTKINGKNCYFVRYGSTSREASREELLRMFQSSSGIHYEVIPVANSSSKDLDFYEISTYFEKYRNINLENFSEEEKQKILINSDILLETKDNVVSTIVGILLFGKDSKKQLPFTGIKLILINGNDLSDPVLDHKFFEKNIFYIINYTIDYINLRMKDSFELGTEARRKDIKSVPIKVIRELIVNAVSHRDYTITGSNITVIIYNNRIEIKSPGVIPNSLTIEKMKQGIMYHRNPVIVQYLYDAGYVERLGRGVRNSVDLMKKFNGTDIKITSDETETVFTVYTGMKG